MESTATEDRQILWTRVGRTVGDEKSDSGHDGTMPDTYMFCADLWASAEAAFARRQLQYKADLYTRRVGQGAD